MRLEHLLSGENQNCCPPAGGYLSAWFLLHYYNFGLRNSDYGLKNPKSKIRIPKYLYLKFGIGQGPDEKWERQYRTTNTDKSVSESNHSRKEVFQPHLPVRLPCYDLAPVTGFTLGDASRQSTLGTPDFHGLTGGVYKARERIHRVIADTRLLAIPAS